MQYSDVQGGWPGDGNIAAYPWFVLGPEGIWTDHAQYDAGKGTTELFDATQDWIEDEHAGKLLNPDIGQYVQSVIVSNTADSITAWGDLREGEWGDQYQINDYRLTDSSPCIDAAANSLVPEDDTDLDEDGNITEKTPRDIVMAPRHLDAEDVVDTGEGSPPVVDMGAYEFAGQIDDDNCYPPRGVIDARQPHPPGDCSLDARQGFGYGNDPIIIAFDPPVAGADDVQFWNLVESGIEQQSESCLEEEEPPPWSPTRLSAYPTWSCRSRVSMRSHSRAPYRRDM
ncbi:MAG: hypothetical protein JSU86_13650 [Phycisphaerales bacterium]|nr:MAG: hypothetical protein JSU86_13650 [Phycisphaerales bacterium]